MKFLIECLICGTSIKVDAERLSIVIEPINVICPKCKGNLMKILPMNKPEPDYDIPDIFKSIFGVKK